VRILHPKRRKEVYPGDNTPSVSAAESGPSSPILPLKPPSGYINELDIKENDGRGRGKAVDGGVDVSLYW
jgi:hypothetical protein